LPSWTHWCLAMHPVIHCSFTTSADRPHIHAYWSIQSAELTCELCVLMNNEPKCVYICRVHYHQHLNDWLCLWYVTSGPRNLSQLTNVTVHFWNMMMIAGDNGEGDYYYYYYYYYCCRCKTLTLLYGICCPVSVTAVDMMNSFIFKQCWNAIVSVNTEMIVEDKKRTLRTNYKQHLLVSSSEFVYRYSKSF